jgi:hypothetical protein
MVAPAVAAHRLARLQRCLDAASLCRAIAPEARHPSLQGTKEAAVISAVEQPEQITQAAVYSLHTVPLC